jgi:DNA processing protein
MRVQEIEVWLRLLSLPASGRRLARELLNAGDSAEACLERICLGSPKGLDGATRAIARRRPSMQAEVQDWLQAKSSRALITFNDALYPPLLRETSDPPLALWIEGQAEHLCLPQLAIVGSRNATPSGLELARNFARSLASSGLCISSGMALGIDAAAHQGALSAKGVTSAVLGSGLARIYPHRHQDLAARIAEQGVLISEFPPFTPPRKEYFPMRNRIISGMSMGVLVVEASLASGSLITARLAADQGRLVFAIPGSPHNPMARGCHSLIRDGASLIDSAEQLLEDLTPIARRMHYQLKLALQPEPALSTRSVSSVASAVFKAMGHEPCSSDVISERTGLPCQTISDALLELDLAGCLHTLPGSRYQGVAGVVVAAGSVLVAAEAGAVSADGAAGAVPASSTG